MHEIHPRILTDANQQPVAVQIDYGDWLEIQELLGLAANSTAPVDLNRFAGTMQWSEDALEFQRRVRAEWDR